MKTRLIGGLTLVAIAAVVATILVTRSGSASAGVESRLAKVRTATTAFHDVSAAEAAGYGKLLACFESPQGGMGQHYVKQSALDATIDPAAPEAMVYEVKPSGLELVGVEYIVPQKAWTKSTPPSLFGRSFGRNDTLGLWALHAWIYRSNPRGTFADFNPNVGACPAK